MRVLMVNTVRTRRNGITNVIFNLIRSIDETQITIDLLLGFVALKFSFLFAVKKKRTAKARFSTKYRVSFPSLALSKSGAVEMSASPLSLRTASSRVSCCSSNCSGFRPCSPKASGETVPACAGHPARKTPALPHTYPQK